MFGSAFPSSGRCPGFAYDGFRAFCLFDESGLFTSVSTLLFFPVFLLLFSRWGGMCVCAQKCRTASMMACSDGPVSFYFLAGRMRRGVMRERVAPVCFEDAGVYDERM